MGPVGSGREMELFQKIGTKVSKAHWEESKPNCCSDPSSTECHTTIRREKDGAIKTAGVLSRAVVCVVLGRRFCCFLF